MYLARPGRDPMCSSIGRHVTRPTPDAQPITHPANDAGTWTMFLVLSTIWGSSFLWIAIGLDEGVAPLALVSMRTLFAGLLLGAVLLVRRGRLPLRWNLWKRIGQTIGDWVARVVLTVFYFTIFLPFGLGVRLLIDPLKTKHKGRAQWLERTTSESILDDGRRLF